MQLFDTTAGQLEPDLLRRFAFAPAKRVLDALADLDAPRIYFAREVGAHLEEAAALGAEVLGVNWTVELAAARRRVGKGPALMGNLDPALLFGSREAMTARAEAILEAMRGDAGFVFNLGHGVLPETPPDNVRHLVDVVHRWK